MLKTGHPHPHPETHELCILIMASTIDGREALRTLVPKTEIGLCVPTDGHNSSYPEARFATLRRTIAVDERYDEGVMPYS